MTDDTAPVQRSEIALTNGVTDMPTDLTHDERRKHSLAAMNEILKGDACIKHGCRHYVTAGDHLRIVRANTPHGQWLSWLDDPATWPKGKTTAYSCIYFSENKALFLEILDDHDEISLQKMASMIRFARKALEAHDDVETSRAVEVSTEESPQTAQNGTSQESGDRYGGVALILWRCHTCEKIYETRDDYNLDGFPDDVCSECGSTHTEIYKTYENHARPDAVPVPPDSYTGGETPDPSGLNQSSSGEQNQQKSNPDAHAVKTGAGTYSGEGPVANTDASLAPASAPLPGPTFLVTPSTHEDWRGADEHKTTPGHSTPNTATPPPAVAPQQGEDAYHARGSAEADGVGTMGRGDMGGKDPAIGGTARRRAKVKAGRFVKEREEIATLLELLYSKVNNNTSLSVAFSNRCISLLERIASELETADVRDCKPSMQMIIDYAESKGIDEGAYWAERFYYYEKSTHWQVGSKYMVDWEAALHNYILKEQGWKQDADARYEKNAAKNGSIHASRARYGPEDAARQTKGALAILRQRRRDHDSNGALLLADGT